MPGNSIRPESNRVSTEDICSKGICSARITISAGIILWGAEIDFAQCHWDVRCISGLTCELIFKRKIVDSRHTLLLNKLGNETLGGSNYTSDVTCMSTGWQNDT